MSNRIINILLLGLTVAGPLTAQQDSLMREAVRLATEGQTDSARAIVLRKLNTTAPMDPFYAEVLFTAGLVSDSAITAVRYFRQVSIEHSSSPWADRALLRLAQLAYAEGDLRAAIRSAQRVLLDYPFSEVRAQAAFWMGRTELDLNNPRSGCRMLAQAQSTAEDDIELANRAGFYLKRCADLLQEAAPDSVAEDVTPSTTQGRTIYAVQVAAVSSAAAADQAMREFTAAGYQSTVFRDTDGLLKVRIGRYTRRQDATTLAVEIRNRLGGNPFVVEQNQ